jgi:formylglycine-generating enzyme
MGQSRRTLAALVAGIAASAFWLACGLEVTGEASGSEPDGNAGVDASSADARGADGEDPSPSVDASALDGPPVEVPDGGCPSGRGPQMVDVGGYCIDSTEVTQAQYAAFIDAMNGSVFTQRNGCSWKTSHLPAGSTLTDCRWDPVANANLPVVCVDWCDADSFCRWAGKRLCGKIGGGAINDVGNDYRHPDKDQWYRACGRPEQVAYPYGPSGMGSACNGVEPAGSGVIAVGSLSTCVGGYPGMFDMSGNASEWEDSCSGPIGPADLCKRRGGSCKEPVSALRCDSYSLAGRNFRDDDTGFRCCSP